jgi:hypothetical protein
MKKSDLDNIFTPLPNTEAQDIAEKYDLLHNITSNLSDDCKRQYQKQTALQQDKLYHDLLIKYFSKIQQYDAMDNNLESSLVPKELNRLHLHPLKIASCIYYFFNDGKNVFPIFCDNDFQSLYIKGVLAPHIKIEKDELKALIYWHKNKTLKLYYLADGWTSIYHRSAMVMKSTSLFIITSYLSKIYKSANSTTDNIPKQNLLQKAIASLHIPDVFYKDPNVLEYTRMVLTSVNNNISQKIPSDLLQFLRDISNGNVLSLALFHDMIVSSFLGPDFMHYSHSKNSTASPEKNVTLICCPSPTAYANILKIIFKNIPSVHSSNNLIHVHNLRNIPSPCIYTEYSPASLRSNLDNPSIIKDELTGSLVNISIEKDKSDLNNLIKFSQENIRYKDGINQNIQYHPTIQTIHFMSHRPANSTLPDNFRVIEFPCDLSGINVSLSSNSCTTLLLLSLFWFLTDHHLQGPDTVNTNVAYTEDKAIKYFTQKFFTNTIDKISKDAINEKMPQDNLSSSSHDGERKIIAEALGIVNLPYTIREDIDTAYMKWKESDPLHIPSIESPTDKVRSLFPSVFYIKQTKLKSKFESDELKERNVKALFGLELDLKALDEATSTSNKNTVSTNISPTEDDLYRFQQFYESMRQTFLTNSKPIIG